MAMYLVIDTWLTITSKEPHPEYYLQCKLNFILQEQFLIHTNMLIEWDCCWDFAIPPERNSIDFGVLFWYAEAVLEDFTCFFLLH